MYVCICIYICTHMHILYDVIFIKNLLAMYRNAGVLTITVPFRKIKAHLYSVPLAIPALTFTIKLFISRTWPKGYCSLRINNLPLILHCGSSPSVRLQLNTAISSGGINITSDGP